MAVRLDSFLSGPGPLIRHGEGLTRQTQLNGHDSYDHKIDGAVVHSRGLMVESVEWKVWWAGGNLGYMLAISRTGKGRRRTVSMEDIHITVADTEFDRPYALSIKTEQLT